MCSGWCNHRVTGKLNFLEPSGPIQACNGTDLPLPFTIIKTNQSVLFRVIAVSCENQKKYFNKMCGQNARFANV